MVIVFAILLFSLLIFVHELGHFVAAKLSGVQVNEFSVFMGPAIVKWRRGETLYAIRCIPIGGYCAMEGEDGETDNPRSFGKAKWWKRLIILLAGSFMNFVVGMLLLFIVLLPAQRFVTPTIAEISPGSSFAEGNRLYEGDKILKMDGERIYVQSDISLLLTVKPAKTYDLLVERNGKRVLLEDVLFEAREFTENGETVKRLGVAFETVDADLWQRLQYTWNGSLDYVRTVRLSLGMLFSGEAGVKDMSGPVGIVDQMSQTASASESLLESLFLVLDFGALIAINLAVMNLLPIPALDGGRAVCLLLTTAVEKITKKKLDPKYEAYLHAAGMILLLGFMAIITFKDIIGLFR